MEANLTVLSCVVDNFCKAFYPVLKSHLLLEGLNKRRRKKICKSKRVDNYSDLFSFVSMTSSKIKAKLSILDTVVLADLCSIF